MTEDMPSAVMNKLSSELKTINLAYEEFTHLFITYSEEKDSAEESDENESELGKLVLAPVDASDSVIEEDLLWEEKDDGSTINGETTADKLSIEELDEKVDGPPPFDKE